MSAAEGIAETKEQQSTISVANEGRGQRAKKKRVIGEPPGYPQDVGSPAKRTKTKKAVEAQIPVPPAANLSTSTQGNFVDLFSCFVPWFVLIIVYLFVDAPAPAPAGPAPTLSAEQKTLILQECLKQLSQQTTEKKRRAKRKSALTVTTKAVLNLRAAPVPPR